MKSIISCTADEKYSYFIPIVTWTWNKLGVGVVLFLPESSKGDEKIQLGLNCMNYGYKENQHYYFDMPKHKEATAAQCVRLYGACLDLPEDEVLVTSDIDMALFKIPEYVKGTFSVFGADLVPDGQVPICYLTATVKQWRDTFNLRYGVLAAEPIDAIALVMTRTYQQCLDELLGGIECENMRGNYWSKDQQEAHDKIFNNRLSHTEIKRARPNTQFADHRVDRDDVNWRSYVNDELIDAHLWRPGYTDENHDNIMELMRMKFPDEDFTWLENYRNAYKQLL